MIEEKKHTGRNIFFILLIILILAGSFAYTKFLPVWQDAKVMAALIDPNLLTITGNVVLSEDYMLSTPEGESITKLMDLEGSKGPSNDLFIYAQKDREILMLQAASSQAPDEWLFQMFLSSPFQYFNGALIYNRIRENLVSGNALAEFLVPTWNGNEYVTADQLHQLFNTDLSKLSKMAPKKHLPIYDAKEYFLVLLTGKRDGHTYSWSQTGLSLTLTIEGNEEDAAITLLADSDDVAAAMISLNDLAAKYHLPFHINDIDTSALKAFHLTVEPFRFFIDVPHETVDQNVIDTLTAIKNFLF